MQASTSSTVVSPTVSPTATSATTAPMSNWQHRFFAFWSAQAVSLFGSNLAQFALVWWLTETTGSATVLATASLVALLPGVLIGPLAGVLVDRWNRRLVINVADGVSAVMALLLAWLFWSGRIEIWHVYVTMAVRAMAGTFQFPAVQSSTALMVPQEQLTRVAGLNQMLLGVTQIVAPPLGALLLGVVPIHWILGIDVISALMAIGLVLLIRLPQPPRNATDEQTVGKPSLWRELRAGIIYIWRWPGLRWLIGLVALTNFMLRPALSLLPILVAKHFQGGALQLAWFTMCFGLGFVVGGLLLSIWGGFQRKIYTGLLGCVGLGVGLVVIALAPAQALLVGMVGLAFASLMMPLTDGSFMAILQTAVAPEMQGRVFTVLMTVSQCMSPLGLAVAGPLVDRIGVQAWYGAAGIACLVLSLVIVLTPTILHLEDR